MRKLSHAASIAVITILMSGGLSCYHGDFDQSVYPAVRTASILSIAGRATVERPSAPSEIVSVRKPSTLVDVLPNIDSSEVVTFENLMRIARARQVSAMPLDSVVQWVGERFVGSTYVGGMLDESETEELVVSFRKYDCVLFMETVLALSSGISQDDYSGAGFVHRLQKLRYRGGEINGYASRLHYFSDWIYDNQQMGFVRDVTEELGGERRTKELNIMSRHRRLYKRLAANDSLHQEIVAMEEHLNGVPQFYIPQSKMKPALELIKPGDIVSTATIARGLDVSHSGFAYRNPDGSVGLLHASSASGEVTITKSLRDYVLGNRLVEGIVVARAIN